MVDAVAEVDHVSAPEFEEEAKDPLVDLDLNDSTELWLIQWPANQVPELDGQELSLKLDRDGELCSFEGKSGKVYNMVSYSGQERDATVFLSSTEGSRIAGKISRHVSLVHYPDPSELENFDSNDQKRTHPGSSMMTMTHSSHRLATPSRRSHGSARSSGKSSLSEAEDPLKTPKRKVLEETSTRVSDRSNLDSGRGHSGMTSSVMSEDSYKKSKKRAESEQ